MSANQLKNKLLNAKELGNAEFKQKKYEEAIVEFNKGIQVYKDNNAVFVMNKGEMKEVATQLFTNKCLACSKLQGKDEIIIEESTHVIKNIDSKNVKALFRRGCAYRVRGEYNGALKDLQEVINLDPKNKQAKIELSGTKKDIEAQLQREVQEKK